MTRNSPPMDRGYGWVMVAIGALMTCVAIGAMFNRTRALRRAFGFRVASTQQRQGNRAPAETPAAVA